MLLNINILNVNVELPEMENKADMQFEKLAHTTKKCLMFRKLENDIAAQQKSEMAAKRPITYMMLLCSIQQEKLQSIDFVAIIRNNPYLVTKATLSLFDKIAKQL